MHACWRKGSGGDHLQPEEEIPPLYATAKLIQQAWSWTRTLPFPLLLGSIYWSYPTPAPHQLFVTSSQVLKGPGEDNLTGRNMLLPGRSVYSSSLALRVAAYAAGACLAHRLTALSGPIHRKALTPHTSLTPPLNTARSRELRLCPQIGLGDWLMHSSNCQHSSPNSETSFHKGFLGWEGGAGQDSCTLMLLETSQQGVHTNNLSPTSHWWWIKEENKPKLLSH